MSTLIAWSNPHSNMHTVNTGDMGTDGVDPGILILYADEEDVHDILGLRNSPINQGATAADSLDKLQEYID